MNTWQEFYVVSGIFHSNKTNPITIRIIYYWFPFPSCIYGKRTLYISILIMQDLAELLSHIAPIS